MPHRISLLGISIDAVTKRQTVEQIHVMLQTNGQHHIATPNNEILLQGIQDEHLRSVLQKTDLNIPDSTGLLLAAKWTGQHLPERVTGVDTATTVCRELGTDCPVFLLGAKEGVAKHAATYLQEINPHISIVGTYAGSPLESEAADIVKRINAVAPHLLFVAYGAPAQECWIHKHLSSLSSVRVAMGVGGTFDFWAGTKKRAPTWMRTFGCEWFWRLCIEPARMKRIWNAVILFPLAIVRHGKTSPKTRSSPSHREGVRGRG